MASRQKNKTSIDENTKIRAGNISFNVIETDIHNDGVIKGNIRGMVISSNFNNDGKISGEKLSLQFSDNRGITRNGKVIFKDGSL
ncbi:hypothetical protein AYY16_05965 [Morganella psychrotolerans]|uniref:hypothetical protein n=1 Tax=Morganella psychrotolerans TaxID=368603 RepID=UPI0007FBAF05|nr:hypothetical protein AYY16_05965 [Morganella psychrotolerans]